MIRRLPIVALALCDGFAQETPMEREAAHDVLKKMDALDKSFDVHGAVARLSLTGVGHRGFFVDAQAMAALQKTYTVPKVPEPK